MTDNRKTPPVGSICFGLTRDIDETSIKALCERFSREDLLSALIPRLSDKELNSLADNILSLINKHFSKNEYHTLFISDHLQENK